MDRIEQNLNMSFLGILQRVVEPLPVRGKGRLANAILRHFTIPVSCHPLPDVTVFLRSDKWIERLMWAGAYEPELVAMLKRALRPGMTVLDMGANIGYFSAIAAALVGPSGRLHAFEPAPSCFGQLERNLVAFPWARAHDVAIADQAGMARFHFSDNGNESGWGSLLDDENTLARKNCCRNHFGFLDSRPSRRTYRPDKNGY